MIDLETGETVAECESERDAIDSALAILQADTAERLGNGSQDMALSKADG